MVEAATSLLSGLGALTDPPVMAMLLLGMLTGLAFGVTPGLGSVACISILTPLTYGLTAMEAVALMAGVMSTTSTSGAVTSIVLNAPGTAPNAATVLDGHPLARRGRAGYAIGAAALASGVGGIFGLVVLFISIPVMRELALAFGPPEVFLLGCLGFLAIGAASGEGLGPTLLAAAAGLMASLIGFDEISGTIRFTFGSLFLWDGLELPAVLVGLFAGGEMLRLWIEDVRVSERPGRLARGQVRKGVRAALRRWPIMLQGSVVGAAVGVTPGIGGTVASFLAYATARATSRRPQRFGRGAIAGVIAPEASNNAKDGGALVPTLAFGIPGSAEMAVFFSVLVLHGVTPGPGILSEHADVLWMLLGGMALTGVAASIITIGAASWFVRIAEIEGRYLAPVALSVCLFGAFAIRSDPSDVAVTCAFSLLGYLFIRAGLPRAPFAIAFVLGPILEVALFQSLLIGDGQVTIFWRSAAAKILLAVLILTSLAPWVGQLLHGTKAPPGVFEPGPASAVADVTLALLIGWVAVAMLILGAQHAPSVRLFPSLAAVLALSCIAGLYWQGLRVRGERLGRTGRIASVTVLLLSWPVLIDQIGFANTALALTLIGGVAVSRLPFGSALGLAAGTSIFIWLIFGVCLGFRLAPI